MLKTTETHLQNLHPLLEFLARIHRAECNQIVVKFSNHWSAEICQSWRDNVYQDKLFAIGRNERGEVVDQSVVVTNARGIDSYHACMPQGLALAYDLFVYDSATKEALWPNIEEMWEAFAVSGKALGLTPGFYFPGKKKDRPHFQLSIPGKSARTLHEMFDDKSYDQTRRAIEELWASAMGPLNPGIFPLLERYKACCA